MVGGRRRKPRAHQGTDVKIGPATRNSFSRMLGSWLGINRSHRIRGWQGVRPVSQVGVHRDQQLAIDLRALIRGFRMPAIAVRGSGRGPAYENRPSRNPRGCGTIYGDFSICLRRMTSERRRDGLDGDAASESFRRMVVGLGIGRQRASRLLPRS